MLMLDAKISAVDTKVESYRREIISELRRVEERVDTRLAAFDETVDTRLASMDARLDAFRRELLAEIRAAAK